MICRPVVRQDQRRFKVVRDPGPKYGMGPSLPLSRRSGSIIPEKFLVVYRMRSNEACGQNLLFKMAVTFSMTLVQL